MEHHLRKKEIGRNYDLGLCYSKDLQSCDNWESQIAVKRAADLLREELFFAVLERFLQPIHALRV